MADRFIVSMMLSSDGDFSVCRRSVEYAAKQTIADQCELIIVCPDAAKLNPDPALLSQFGNVQFIEIKGQIYTGSLMSAAVHQSQGRYVVYVEEHNYPPPQLMERAAQQMDRHGYEAMGFSMTVANPGRVAFAHLYLQFGHAAAPVKSGEVDRLGGHHAMYRKELLLSFAESLSDLAANEAVLHELLRKRGTKMYMLGDVPVPHAKVSDLWALMTLEWVAQRIYAATRADRLGWTARRRAAYAAAAPLILALRVWRAWGHARRTGRGLGFILGMTPALLCAAASGAVAEARGYLFGMSDVDVERRTAIELDRYGYVNKNDKAQPRAPRAENGALTQDPFS